MSIICAELNENIVKEFRNTVYSKSGLKRGDFQKSLQEALEDYVIKYFDSSHIRELSQLQEHTLQTKINGDF